MMLRNTCGSGPTGKHRQFFYRHETLRFSVAFVRRSPRSGCCTANMAIDNKTLQNACLPLINCHLLAAELHTGTVAPLTQRRTVKGIPPETDSMRQNMKRPTYGWYSKTGALRCTELHTTWTTAHSKNLEVSVTRQKRGWEGGKRFVMLRLTHGYGPTDINDSSPSYMKRCDSALHEYVGL